MGRGWQAAFENPEFLITFRETLPPLDVPGGWDYMLNMNAPPATVLYVEDEASHAYLMQRAFMQAGLADSFQTVPDGPAAVSYLAGDRTFSDRSKYPLPKVVLLDLRLPDMNGLELLEWIRCQSNHRQLPVVVFSVSGEEEDKTTAKALHADEYWLKPESPDEFPRLVQRVKEKWLS